MATSVGPGNTEPDEKRQEAVAMRRFRRILIALTLISLFAYPLLSLITWQVRIHGGINLREHGPIFQHDPISDPGMYLLVGGLPVVVALWFVYGAVTARMQTAGHLWSGFRTAIWIVTGGFASFLSFFGSFMLFVLYLSMLEKLFP